MTLCMFTTKQTVTRSGRSFVASSPSCCTLFTAVAVSGGEIVGGTIDISYRSSLQALHKPDPMLTKLKGIPTDFCKLFCISWSFCLHQNLQSNQQTGRSIKHIRSLWKENFIGGETDASRVQVRPVNMSAAPVRSHGGFYNDGLERMMHVTAPPWPRPLNFNHIFIQCFIRITHLILSSTETLTLNLKNTLGSDTQWCSLKNWK